MPELRYNPLLDTWTMVATNRQHRPHLPKDYCPFCPSHNKQLPDFDVLAYPNDFPVMAQGNFALIGRKQVKSVYQVAEAYGRCEVILYSPDHHKQLYQLSDEHVLKIVNLWQQRFTALSLDKRIKYIFEFENRGEEVGVTIHHPHGQLYAYSFVPHKIETELRNCKKYYQKHQRSLFADLNREEKKYGKRVVAENNSFIAYIPFFSDYPFGVFVVSKKLKPNIASFSPAEKKDLALMLKDLTRAFDQVYDRMFPYMMCLHQTPVNEKKYADAHNYYAFHIEFYPPLRAKDKLKWYAGSEMGAGAAANPLDVDDCATTLRHLILKNNHTL